MLKFSTTSFTIAVLSVMRLVPIMSQNLELAYVIVEERPPMAHVGNVLEDSNIRDLVSSSDISDLRFSFLTEGNPQASYLWINSTSGEMKTSTRINRESICQRLVVCELRVQTVVQAQLGAFFMIIQVKVTVTDINDNAPTFSPSSITIKVSEGEVSGASFRLPTATDPDMGAGNSVMGYTAQTQSGPFNLVVDGTPSSLGISIRLNDELDREVKETYRMLVHAIDGGIPKLTGTLTVNIEVTDINDNSPVFDQDEYSVNISDSLPVDSVVARVKATDLDVGENGVVTYLLSPIQEDLIVVSMFYVNSSSGDVKNKVSLDSYAGRSYRLTIDAQDSAPTHKTTSVDVIIVILDTHNSQPQILLNVLRIGGLAQVSELAELGRVVAHVAVSDPDSSHSSNGQVTCLMNNTEQFQLQAMDVKQFKIILTKRLDREQVSFHSLTVICEDSGTPPLNATSTFIVEVKDENDNPPVFDSLYYTADVSEGWGSGTGSSHRSGDAIVRVHASDRDVGENAQITYRLAEGSDSDFGIYNDGSVVVTNPDGVDREDRLKGSVRKLTVLAVDGGKNPLTATATIVVTIGDINDNPPKFTEPMYFFSVPENSPTGHIVNNVSATDADLENNAIFYFEIHKRDAHMVPFQISPAGVVKVAGGIDREIKASYEFRVVAYDMGELVRQSSTVVVRVKVADINDNSPYFVFPNDDNYTLYVPHTLGENTAFGSILATDRDEGRNSDLVFARDSGNGSKFFDVESESGHVILVRPLTMRELGLHIIVVFVHDRGVDVQMATQSILHIVVYEGNATVPYRDDGLGFRNIVVVVVLIVVTVVLAVAILLTILLIRRVDKQRRLYNTKVEEIKADSRRFNPCSIADPESPSAFSDLTGDAKEGSKKKKEVSFSLEEENNVNSSHTMTTFNPAASDKYDAISEKDRGKLKNDMMSSNHYQADRQTKSSSVKKDFNYHLVHPTSTSGQKHKQPTDSAGQNQDGNSSDASCDSTSDSGRGGSDVDLQSHGGVSKDSGDTSFMSQRALDTHNNLNAISSSSSSNTTSNLSNLGSSVKHPSKSVHFQNIRPDPMGFSSFVSPNKPVPTHRSPRSPILPGVAAHRHGSNMPRYVPNVVPEHSEGFMRLPISTNGRCSNPSYKDLELQRSRVFSDSITDSQISRRASPSALNADYSDMAGMRSCMSQKSNSNSCLDGAETWDGDTTTSGSYTVDPQELCDEIDKLFFDDVQDIVV